MHAGVGALSGATRLLGGGGGLGHRAVLGPDSAAWSAVVAATRRAGADTAALASMVADWIHDDGSLVRAARPVSATGSKQRSTRRIAASRRGRQQARCDGNDYTSGFAEGPEPARRMDHADCA